MYLPTGTLQHWKTAGTHFPYHNAFLRPPEQPAMKPFVNIAGPGRLIEVAWSGQALSYIPRAWLLRRDSPAMVFFPAPSTGSLGDEAMFVAATSGLRALGFRHIALVIENRPQKGHLSIRPTSLHDPRAYFGRKPLLRLKFLLRLAGAEGFFVLGADVMDGHYSPQSSIQRISLIHLASRLGISARVFGFSFNQDPDPTVIAAMRVLPDSVTLLARDPLSHRRLERVLCRPVGLVADLAFLLPPDSTGECAKHAIDWIDVQRAQGARIIGLNANPLLAKNRGAGVLAVATALARLMDRLLALDSSLRFVMIPHDSRGALDDAALHDIAVEMASSFGRLNMERVFRLSAACGAAQMKAVCKHLDFVISGRMHLAVACLGQNIPVVCIGYQGKMEGLFEHFQLSGMTIEPSTALREDEFLSFVKQKLGQSEEIKAGIARRADHVLELAQSNFSDLRKR